MCFSLLLNAAATTGRPLNKEFFPDVRKRHERKGTVCIGTCLFFQIIVLDLWHVIEELQSIFKPWEFFWEVLESDTMKEYMKGDSWIGFWIILALSNLI